MTSPEVAVVIGGTALIAWINWYFLFSGSRATQASRGAGGVVEVPIVVHGGYEPSVVSVPRGERLRLVFDRRETAGCSEEVVIPAFGVRRFLPPFERTTIELTPDAAGRFEFTCGMGMLRGALVVEDRA